MPCASLHGIHCIQSRFISPRCMESTAFSRDPLCSAAWNPLHSIRIHWAKLHAIHCIHSEFISHCCMESSAFNHTAWNPLHSIRIHCAMLHGILCLHSGSIVLHCMESTAFNQDPLSKAACSVAQWIPIECSGFQEACLNAVDSMQSGAMYLD